MSFQKWSILVVGGNIYIYTCICPPPPFLKDINEHMLYILIYILFFSHKKVNFGNCSILAHMLLAHVHVPHTINLLVPFWTFRLEHILYRKWARVAQQNFSSRSLERGMGLKGRGFRRVKMLVAQSYLLLRDPMDCSLTGFSVHGILQAKIQ